MHISLPYRHWYFCFRCFCFVVSTVNLAIFDVIQRFHNGGPPLALHCICADAHLSGLCSVVLTSMFFFFEVVFCAQPESQVAQRMDTHISGSFWLDWVPVATTTEFFWRFAPGKMKILVFFPPKPIHPFMPIFQKKKAKSQRIFGLFSSPPSQFRRFVLDFFCTGGGGAMV